jgi:hypothetical protein
MLERLELAENRQRTSAIWTRRGRGSMTVNQVLSACALRWRKSGSLRLRMLI